MHTRFFGAPVYQMPHKPVNSIALYHCARTGRRDGPLLVLDAHAIDELGLAVPGYGDAETRGEGLRLLRLEV